MTVARIRGPDPARSGAPASRRVLRGRAIQSEACLAGFERRGDGDPLALLPRSAPKVENLEVPVPEDDVIVRPSFPPEGSAQRELVTNPLNR